jgi:hypothetical protein
MTKGKNLKAVIREGKLGDSYTLQQAESLRKPPQSTSVGKRTMPTEKSTNVSVTREIRNYQENQSLLAMQQDWMTPQQEAELEEHMIELGKRKYGFDEQTAREWAHAFCSESAVSPE